jgi:hypothetical protein
MTKSYRTLDDVDVKGKRVLLRVDLNVPMDNGRVTDATRMERIAPTITEISGKGGKVILLAHFGRPKGRDAKESLKPVAAALAQVINKPVGFADDCIGEAAASSVAAMKDGDILCLENTRFHKGEEKNDPALIDAIAALDADVTSIEAARSRGEVISDVAASGFDHGIGPGVYDIHSPRVPQASEMLRLLQKAATVIPADNLWVNPDCGLKTRGWPETEVALRHMVEAARQLREQVHA